jgi:hypothetical protein
MEIDDGSAKKTQINSEESYKTAQNQKRAA